MKREGIPDGSFVFVSATGLLVTWWAYKRRLIQFRDLRVWLASHELLAQRWFCEKGQVPRFHVEDLAPLVGGVGGEHFRASLRRLGAVGLLSWSESRIEPILVLYGQARGKPQCGGAGIAAAARGRNLCGLGLMPKPPRRLSGPPGEGRACQKCVYVFLTVLPAMC